MNNDDLFKQMQLIAGSATQGGRLIGAVEIYMSVEGLLTDDNKFYMQERILTICNEVEAYFDLHGVEMPGTRQAIAEVRKKINE